MSAQITVKPGEMTALIRYLERAIEQTRDILSELDGRVASLRGSWAGRAQEAYDTAQAEWLAEIERMVLVLAHATAALTRADTRYDRTESANAARWQL